MPNESNPAPEEAIAAVRGVDKTFLDETGRERVILKGVDFTVRKGEVVVVLGPSGCGKSTLLRVLIGLIPPTRGTVTQHGRPLEGLHPSAAVVWHMTTSFKSNPESCSRMFTCLPMLMSTGASAMILCLSDLQIATMVR